ncbi:MAG: DUF3570 domain-containing protein [Proteobacteria bacterium]|nr:DUF3570 domain-containing protein [Pseudomonadota bacterium]
MQLKKQHNVRKALALATASLLGTPANAASADDTWQLDSTILFYSETDRVQTIKPVVSAKKDLGEEETVSIRFLADSLSGASPNGAIATDTAQTFTTASGESTYTVPAGETPLDPDFKDVRYALNGSWEKPLSRLTKAVLGANVSKETDYQSLGVSASLSRDINQRNTTLTAGLSFNSDTIEPFNGVPVPFSPMNPGTPMQTLGTSEDKTVADFLIGWTQVIDRKTLMQLNLNVGKDSGYMTDPYKILSVVNPGTETLRATDPYLYEHRPDSRQRQALYWKLVRNLSGDVVNMSYRYYWDDWGIKSHTIDAHYRFDFNEGQYLQPHVRYYQQSKADFYNYKLEDGTLPEFASADYRLGDLTTTTVGFKYGFTTSKDSEISARLEYMKQSANGDDPFPDVDAVIFQLSYASSFNSLW